MEQEKQLPVAWFKRDLGDEIYHYYEVHGGPGKPKDGYVVAVRFRNPRPRSASNAILSMTR